jgi:hypothetical protein
VDRDRLVLGLAAVFTGLTVLLVVLSFVYSLFRWPASAGC